MWGDANGVGVVSNTNGNDTIDGGAGDDSIGGDAIGSLNTVNNGATTRSMAAKETTPSVGTLLALRPSPSGGNDMI